MFFLKKPFLVNLYFQVEAVINPAMAASFKKEKPCPAFPLRLHETDTESGVCERYQQGAPEGACIPAKGIYSQKVKNMNNDKMCSTCNHNT